MKSRILTGFVFLFVVTGTLTKQCFECSQCPEPFNENGQGVRKISVADRDYCVKIIRNDVVVKRNGGPSCRPVGLTTFCCKDDLCNGAESAIISVKLLAAMVTLFFTPRFMS
ncbi:unnamed protein product [Adineta ricciae]|uniref:Uncharacterized protein n=1 Tax=Adineta ricciae TaxID=249248 RepID=A0A814PFX2_ADIRI|nr:unnamed protein product [Adineta ricciae]